MSVYIIPQASHRTPRPYMEPSSPAAVGWLGSLLPQSVARPQLLSMLAPEPDPGGLPSLETTIILGLGAFLGSIAMGICGFGTAILHLCVWAIAGGLGYNAGSLQLAVIACSCAMTISMIPFFFLANATTHAIRPLAISISIFKALAAPLGALVLKVLPARELEGVVAGLMLLLMLLINREEVAAGLSQSRTWAVGRWQAFSSSCRGSKRAAAAALLRRKQVASLSSVDIRAAAVDDATDDLRLPLVATGSDADSCDGNSSVSSSGSVSSNEQQGVRYPAVRARPPRLHTINDCSSSQPPGDPGLDEVDCIILTPDLDDTPLSVLQAAAAATESVGQQQQSEDQLEGPGHVSAPAALADVEAGSRAEGQQQQQQQEDEVDEVEEALLRQHGFWTLFVIGSVTGLCTGLLGGATGISGPPMMIMYAYLKASKAAVRGTNAVMSMVQDQLIGYFLLGMLHWADRWVYLASAVGGALGMLLGHALQRLMHQDHFNAVMTLLMLLCFMLMTLSAAGVLQLAAGV